LSDFEYFRNVGNLNAAIVEAIDLGRAFERLLHDARFAEAVDAYYRGRSQPTVPDSIIEAVSSTYPKKKDAAVAARLSERQMRRRRAALHKRTCVGRPPPK
jgi:hypothetical protein